MPLTINGDKLSDRVLDQELLRLSAGLEMDAPQAGGVDPAQLRSLALRNVIDRTLLLQAATARQLRVTPDEVAAELSRRWGVNRNSVCDPGAMDGIREEILLERVIADLTRHVPRPGRAETQQFYRANQPLYRLPAGVEAAHILCGVTAHDSELAAYAAIVQADKELGEGRPFAKVANRYSDCKGVGGSVGWVTRGTMVQAFEEVVFALSAGERSGIFRTVFGYHIATVLRHRKEGLRPFDEVRPEIAKRLLTEAREQQLRLVLDQWKAKSDIRYTEEPSHA